MNINLIPFKGWPIPDGWSLVCPHCNKYKMYQRNNSSIFKCAGIRECGKLTTKLEVETFIGQVLVED